METLAWVKLVGDDRFYYRSDGYHPITNEDDLAKVVNYHKFQHAIYHMNKMRMRGPTTGYIGVVLRTLLNDLGYIPYVPVTDVGKKCPECWALGIGHDGYDWLRANID